MSMGAVGATNVLKASSAAEWVRLLAALEATGATAKKPMPPFTSVRVDANKRTLTLEQHFPANW